MKEINYNSEGNNSSPIEPLFWKIRDFFAIHTISNKNDILSFFIQMINFRDELTNLYFELSTTWIPADFSPRQVDEEDNIVQGEWEYYNIVNMFFSDIYEYEDAQIYWKVRREMMKNDEPLSLGHIAVEYADYVGPLENIEDSPYIDELMWAYAQSIERLKRKILYELDKKKKAAERKEQEKYQKVLEEKQGAIIRWLLATNASEIVPHKPHIARESDFADGYVNVQSIIHEVYAEKAEYFNNLFLWFDLKEGRFQTMNEKQKQYNVHFYKQEGENVQTRLQEINKIQSEDSNLPVLVSGVSDALWAVIEKNTTTILQTEEQKITDHFNNCAFLLSPKEQEDIKAIILQSFKSKQPKTKEERNKIVWKKINQFIARRHWKNRKLDIKINIDQKIKNYISDNIEWCYDQTNFSKKEYSNIMREIFATARNWWEIIILPNGEQINLPQFVRDDLNKKRERIDKEKKELELNFGGSWFDFLKIQEDEQFKRDTIFFSRLWISNFAAVYVRALSWFVSKKTDEINTFIKERFSLIEKHNHLIAKTLQSYLFLKDVRRLKELEKEIQEKIDVKFVRDEESISAVLSAIMIRVFTTDILYYHDDDDGMSNMEKKCTEWTKRFSFYTEINNVPSSCISTAYQKTLNKLKDNYQLEIFLSIIKKLELKIVYDKKIIAAILQKEHDDLQYDTSNFEISSANRIEKVKQRALDFWITLNLPPVAPLEAYYIHRLRTPEEIKKQDMNEMSFDRYSWEVGYSKDNLADITTLMKLASDVWISLSVEDILAIDIRRYKNIPQERRFDLQGVVPVAVNFPKVDCLFVGNWDEKGKMEGYYVLAYDPETEMYSLTFDDSCKNAEIVMIKYNLSYKLILGWGYLVFSKESNSVVVQDRINNYHHEPRIITVTALKNILKEKIPQVRIFIGDDGISNLDDLWW